MMLREDQQRMHDEFRYVQDMGLNTVRLEGKLENKAFFDMADRQGILVMAGWVCCVHWEHWAKWKPQDFVIAEQSLRDQIYRLRSHPSMFMWLNGSDNPPPPDVEQTVSESREGAALAESGDVLGHGKPTSVTGESGVKMSGPLRIHCAGILVQDRRDCGQPPQVQSEGGCGGAYGFNTETSMGPAVPPIESIRAHGCRKITGGRSTTGGITTPAAA